MIQLLKIRSIYCSAGILTAAFALITCTLTWKTAAAHVSSHFFYSTLTGLQDTVPIIKNDTIPNKNDSLSDSTIAKAGIDSTQKIDTFSFKVSKDSLDAPVNYEAEDSAVVMIAQKKNIPVRKNKNYLQGY